MTKNKNAEVLIVSDGFLQTADDERRLDVIGRQAYKFLDGVEQVSSTSVMDVMRDPHEFLDAAQGVHVIALGRAASVITKETDFAALSIVGVTGESKAVEVLHAEGQRCYDELIKKMPYASIKRWRHFLHLKAELAEFQQNHGEELERLRNFSTAKLLKQEWLRGYQVGVFAAHGTANMAQLEKLHPLVIAAELPADIRQAPLWGMKVINEAWASTDSVGSVTNLDKYLGNRTAV